MPNKSVEPATKHANPKVSFLILTHMAWRNLIFKRLRAMLTIFGVVIGIGSIYFLFSFGLGLQNLITQKVVGNSSIKSIDVTSQNPKLIRLDDETVNKIKRLPHVESGGISYSFPGSMKYDGSSVEGIVYGVDKIYQKESNLNISAGKQLDFENNKTVLVDEAVLESMGVKDKESAVGQIMDITVSLSASGARASVTGKFKIQGVVDDVGGNEVYIPAANFSNAGVPNYTQLKLQADDSSNVANLRKQIETLSLATTSPADTIEQINQIFKFFNLILVGFGAIGMVVAVLGMFNTLTISLLERTKEIGLMMALGARRTDLRKLFFFEAILLSLIGAIIGIVMAMFAGRIVNFIMNFTAQRRGVTEGFEIFSNPWWLILGTIIFMVTVGAMVVYLPAKRAERTDPIDALRNE